MMTIFPHGQGGYNPLKKPGTVYETVLSCFKSVWYAGKNVCIDEGMIPFRGKVHMRVYAPDKPNKYGLKQYELCDSVNAYCSVFKLYTGKDDSQVSVHARTHDLVMDLMTSYLDKGLILYVDNYYSSPKLFMDLFRRGTRATDRLFPSTRGSLALVAFFGCIIIYLMRINLSVAIVCMTIEEEDGPWNVTTESTRKTHWNYHSSYMWAYDDNNWHKRSQNLPYDGNTEKCPGEGDGDDEEETGEFYWDRDLRGTINSSFFWGYVLTQVIGGILARRYGAKWILGIGSLFLIVPTMLSPPASHLSPYALMAMRFIKGLGSGVFFPCIHHIWALWAPPNEKSFLLSFVMSGNSLGSVLSFALSGVICAELGWEWIFWVYGIVGIVWFVLWIIFAFDPPENHPRISEEELRYISVAKQSQEKGTEGQQMKIPWVKILTSPTVLCIYLAQFCSAWGGYTTLTSLPQYMEDVLKINIKQNGFFNSLPHLLKFLFSILFAIIADILISRKILSTGATRRLMQSLGFIIPAIFLSVVGYLDCFSEGLVIFCLTCAEGFTAGTRAGCLSNILDVAPGFAGILMGIGNTIGNISGIFAPIVAAQMTPDGSQEQWRGVFFLSVGLFLSSWVVFMIFCKGEVQAWALPADVLVGEEIVSKEDSKDTKDDKVANGYTNNAFNMQTFSGGSKDNNI